MEGDYKQKGGKMPRLSTDTLTNQSLATALLLKTFTADREYSSLMFQVYLDQVQGNGDYKIWLTHQVGGAGDAYKTAVTTDTLSSGETAHKFGSVQIPANNTDVIKVYVLGLSTDTTTPDITTEIWDLGYLRPTTAGLTVDVSSTGEIGLDFSNIKAASSPTTLTNITVPVTTTLTNDPTGVTTLLSGLVPTNGTVNDAGASTTVFITTLSSSVNNFYKGEAVVFTSGSLSGQLGQIKAYDGSTKAITLQSALTSAPVNGVSFVVATVAASRKLADFIASLGTDNKPMISTDSQDLSTTLFVDAKKFNTATYAPSNIVQILGTTLTETAGYLAAGFKKFFNVVTPIMTLESVNQTGDTFPLIGSPANISVSGDIAGVLSAVLNIQNNSFVSTDIPSTLERPDTGSGVLTVTVLFNDTTGTPHDIDGGANPTTILVSSTGIDLSSRLGAWSHPSLGKYTIPYTNSSTDSIDNIHWEFTATLDTKLRRYVATTQIVDTTAVNFTSTDRDNLVSANNASVSVDGKLTTGRASNLDNLDVSVSTRSTLSAPEVWVSGTRTLTSYGTLVADIWANTTRSLTTFGTLVSDVWNYVTRSLTEGGSSLTASEIWAYARRTLTMTSSTTTASDDERYAELTQVPATVNIETVLGDDMSFDSVLGIDLTDYDYSAYIIPGTVGATEIEIKITPNNLTLGELHFFISANSIKTLGKKNNWYFQISNPKQLDPPTLTVFTRTIMAGSFTVDNVK